MAKHRDWTVRVVVSNDKYGRESWVEERVVWASNERDAIAIAASRHEGIYVLGCEGATDE